MLAVLNAGDSILGFDLSHGGHLTHGSTVNYSGKLYKPHFYGVEKETGTIDMDKVAATAAEVKPKLIIVERRRTAAIGITPGSERLPTA